LNLHTKFKKDDVMSKDNKINIEFILENIQQFHPSDIASKLKKLHKKDKEKFYDILHKIPSDYLGEVLLELPDSIRDKAYSMLPTEKITQALEDLETDDATDIIQDLEEIDEQKASDILNSLDQDDQDEINWLKKYDEDEAGAYMQTELFSANQNETIQESIDRLKKLKKEDRIENIHQVFIVDDNTTLIASVLLEDILTLDFSMKYSQVILNEHLKTFEPLTVLGDDRIDEVAKIFEDYNLSVIPVVGYKNRLLGRITSDDILDVIEQNATEQMYQLAGVNEDSENDEKLLQTGKRRASWLFLNLLTAIMASLVIGLFDDVLQEYIALAILMPIVASMGGNAGTQTLAVMVRKLALGEIEDHNSRDAITKEIYLSLFNGMIFALLLGVIAFVWFDNGMLGVVIAMAMITTLFCSGLFGASIPLFLKKLKIDPAIGSTVLLTTVTDIMGFFSFLALAKWIL
jgi:magnesium transporter